MPPTVAFSDKSSNPEIFSVDSPCYHEYKLQARELDAAAIPRVIRILKKTPEKSYNILSRNVHDKSAFCQPPRPIKNLYESETLPQIKIYRRAHKKDTGRILDEFVELTGYDRYYAGYILRQAGKRARTAAGELIRVVVFFHLVWGFSPYIRFFICF
jgi:hypothetical protein